MKRDDMSGGVELGGNKVRKLEFLLAEALALGHDSVVTIGGEQSNHCRATASAARMVGLEPHLILRSARADSVHAGEDNFGLVGNLLIDRMVGSKIYTCTPGEYGRVGSKALVERLCQYLRDKESKNPYPIPVGGSNGCGTWGYLQAVDELAQQWDEPLDHVVFATGSGGTASGIALGLALCPSFSPKVHAVGVCDDPEYFYSMIAEIATQMGLGLDQDTLEFVKQTLVVYQGKGLGYAVSTTQELSFCTQFAKETGVALDPVYSGKALYHFVTQVLEQDPDTFRDSTVLFWHTGGALGMYDKTNELAFDDASPVKRLDVYEKQQDGMVSI
jgi:D-cysteine desulfhydrase family pyridoxal phosphate-dependent enzyme